MPRILQQHQIEYYRERGYLHAKGVIPHDLLKLMRLVLERWVDLTIDRWKGDGLLSQGFEDLDFSHRLNHAWQNAGRPKYVRSPRRDLVSPEMYQILTHRTMLDLAEDLLGTPEISVHGIFNARPKLPDQIWTRTPWHQDAQYYQQGEDVHIVSLWVPLQTVTETNSCLQVAPGRHRDPLYERYEDQETGFIGLAPEITRQLTGLSIEMEPGDVLCFPQRMPHRALANKSDSIRWSIDLRYEPTEFATPEGKPQGFVARCPSAPDKVVSYETWRTQWADIPAGSY